MFVSHWGDSESKGDYTKPKDVDSILETKTEKIE